MRRARRASILLVLLTLVLGCSRAGTTPGPGVPPDLPPSSTERDRLREPSDSTAAGSAPAPATPADADAVSRPPATGMSVAEAGVRLLAAPGERPSWLAPRLPSVDEVRGVWIVRTSLVDEERARAAVRHAAGAGFNTLLVQVRGRGDAWYRSRWEPRADALRGTPEAFDPLAVVLDEARRLGVAVHAWVNVNLVASARLPPENPGHLWNAHPEWAAVPRALARELFVRSPADDAYRRALLDWTRDHADRVEGVYTNPSHPDVTSHVLRVVEDLVGRYELDGLHLDYLRYPSPDFDYSRASLTRFRAHVRSGFSGDLQLPAAELAWRQGDPFGYTDRYGLEWARFRRDRSTELMERIFVTARRTNPSLLVSVAVRGDPDDARDARFQPWEEWLRSGVPDAIVPMAYTDSVETFRRWIARAVASGAGDRVWAGVGSYRTSLAGAVEQARTGRALGTRGTVLFSYDWAAGPEGAAMASGDYLSRFSSAFGVGH